MSKPKTYLTISPSRILPFGISGHGPYLAGSREEAVAIGVKAEMGDAPLVPSQQGEKRAIIPGIQTQRAAVGATGIEGLSWAEGYAGDDATLTLLFC